MKPGRGFLINRDYARLWSGQAASTVGDYVFDTTLTLWVATEIAKGKTWAPAAVSGVLLSVGAAVLLVGPLAGVFVDRWSHRRIMLNSELVRAGLVVILLLLSLVPVHDLPAGVWLTCIYLIVFGLNVAAQFFSPARFATIGAIVPGEADRARAAGIGQATTGAASILGPPLAAPLLFTVGVQWAMLINAISYVCSYLAIRSVRFPEAEKTSNPSAESSAMGAGSRLRQEFVSGVRYFAGSRLLVTLLTAAVITQIGTGALNTLNVFFTTRNLHGTSGQYGFVSMAFGAGAIIGSLLAGRVVGRIGARTATWSGLLLTGLLVFAYSRQNIFAVGVLVLLLVAIPVATLNTAMTPLLLEATPPEYLGRVVAVFNPVNELASMLSAVVAGWLASSALMGFHSSIAGVRFGPIDTIFAVSGLMIVLAGCYAAAALPRDRKASSPVVVEAGVEAGT